VTTAELIARYDGKVLRREGDRTAPQLASPLWAEGRNCWRQVRPSPWTFILLSAVATGAPFVGRHGAAPGRRSLNVSRDRLPAGSGGGGGGIVRTTGTGRPYVRNFAVTFEADRDHDDIKPRRAPAG
jgi:hypothetical protein